MSFFEDYVEDGLCCMCCGQLIDGDEPGYPRYCEFCEPKKYRRNKNKKGKKNMKNQDKMQIISVVYEDNKEPKKFDTESRTYSYYTQLNLQVGDIVDCPVRKK